MTARLRGSCMQLGRLAGKGGNPPPVAGNHRLLGREPGSAHAADVGKGKKVGRGCGRDATGGAKNHVRERPAERLEHAYPHACWAGKSLSAEKPAARAAITSEGVITPGSGKLLARAASI